MGGLASGHNDLVSPMRAAFLKDELTDVVHEEHPR